MVSNNYIYVARNRLNWKRERVSDLASSLQSYLDQSTPEYDQWNNPMITIPFTLHSEYGGTFTLKNPNIRYDYSPTVDITESIVSYMEDVEESEQGWVDVPATITAEDDVNFTVETTITYESRGPLLREPIPSTYSLQRGETVQYLIDLSDYFYDPVGHNISYSISYQQSREDLSASVDGPWLNFNAGDELGAWEFRVNAVNEVGYSLESNTFEVHVVPPPPEIDLPEQFNVREDVRTWYSLDDHVVIPEGLEDVTLSGDSDHVDVHDNLTMELYYEEVQTEFVTITIEAGPYTVEDTTEVHVRAYDQPFFEPLPDVMIEKNEALEEGEYYLPEYVDHPDENTSDFDYEITAQTDQENIPVELSNNYVVTVPEEDHHGETEVTVRVEHEGYSDMGSFVITVNNTRYPPEFVGELEDVHLTEGESWRVNLRELFDYAEPWRLRYSSSHPDVNIVDDHHVEWRPEYGDHELIEDVTFTAQDMEFPQLRAESDPITLEVEWINQPPEYLGNLYSRVIMPNETWEVNLFDHFTDREDPYNMTFSTNKEQLNIENGNVSWTPEEPGDSLRDVTFTAHDAEDPDLNTTSDPINLIVPLDDHGPFAWIDRPLQGETFTEDEVIHFVGNHNATQGNVTYEWTSDIDGYLSGENEFNTTLSQGEHEISFRVRDERDEWSETDHVQITITEEEEPEPEETDRQWIHVGLILMIVGLTVTYIGKEIGVRRG